MSEKQRFFAVEEDLHVHEGPKIVSAVGDVMGEEIIFLKGLKGHVVIPKEKMNELFVASTIREAAELYVDKKRRDLQHWTHLTRAAEARFKQALDLQKVAGLLSEDPLRWDRMLDAPELIEVSFESDLERGSEEEGG